MHILHSSLHDPYVVYATLFIKNNSNLYSSHKAAKSGSRAYKSGGLCLLSPNFLIIEPDCSNGEGVTCACSDY